MSYYFVSFKIFVKGLNGGTFTISADKPCNTLTAAEDKLARMTLDENNIFSNVSIMSRTIDIVNNDPNYITEYMYMERYNYTVKSGAELVRGNAVEIIPVPREYIKKMEDY